MLDKNQWLALGLLSGFAYILGKDRESFEAEEVIDTEEEEYRWRDELSESGLGYGNANEMLQDEIRAVGEEEQWLKQFDTDDLEKCNVDVDTAISLIASYRVARGYLYADALADGRRKEEESFGAEDNGDWQDDNKVRECVNIWHEKEWANEDNDESMTEYWGGLFSEKYEKLSASEQEECLDLLGSMGAESFGAEPELVGGPCEICGEDLFRDSDDSMGDVCLSCYYEERSKQDDEGNEYDGWLLNFAESFEAEIFESQGTLKFSNFEIVQLLFNKNWKCPNCDNIIKNKQNIPFSEEEQNDLTWAMLAKEYDLTNYDGINVVRKKPRGSKGNLARIDGELNFDNLLLLCHSCNEKRFKEKKESVSFRTSKEKKEWLENLAKDKDLGMAELMNDIVDEYRNNYEAESFEATKGQKDYNYSYGDWDDSIYGVQIYDTDMKLKDVKKMLKDAGIKTKKPVASLARDYGFYFIIDKSQAESFEKAFKKYGMVGSYEYEAESFEAKEMRREWTFLWKPKNEGWGNSVYAKNLNGAKEQILKTYSKGSSFFQRADLSTLTDDPFVNKQRWRNWDSQWNAESFEAEYTLKQMAEKSFKEIDKISGFVADRLNHTQESWSKLPITKRKKILRKIRKDEDGWFDLYSLDAESFEAEKINTFSEIENEWKDSSVTIYDEDADEFYGVKEILVQEGDDVLEDGHPYLVLNKDSGDLDSQVFYRDFQTGYDAESFGASAEDGMENVGYPVEWEDVRRDMKYPKEDNNNGLIYGVEWVDGEEIVDISWFKTEAERDAELKKAKEWYRKEYGAESFE